MSFEWPVAFVVDIVPDDAVYLVLVFVDYVDIGAVIFDSVSFPV